MAFIANICFPYCNLHMEHTSVFLSAGGIAATHKHNANESVGRAHYVVSLIKSCTTVIKGF